MKYAIELKPTYTILSLNTEVMDKEVAEAVLAKVKEVANMSSAPSFIVNMDLVNQLNNDAIESLLELQEFVEQEEGKIIFIGFQEVVLQKVKQERLHLSIHIANSLDEAEDLVKDTQASMEQC